MRDDANAKINLFLRVRGKRPDGYHDLEMLNVSLDLSDTVELTDAEPGIEISGEITGIELIPADERNLAWRAAKFALERRGETRMKRIRIIKRIPAGAGLAGGSTDAAAVIRMISGSKASDDYTAIAHSIGADVPYCIHRGPAVVGGIGEKIWPIAMKRQFDIILVNPGIHVATKDVFANLNAEPIEPDNERVNEITLLEAALVKGEIEELDRLMKNDLEKVTSSLYPEIAELKSAMCESGAIAARMSGSGPTVFGIFKDEASAVRGEAYWASRKIWSCRTRSII